MKEDRSYIPIDITEPLAKIDRILKRVEELSDKMIQDEWINQNAAKKLLGLKSDTSMFNLRSKGCIEFSQPTRKVIMYKRSSIIAYLEKHSYKTF